MKNLLLIFSALLFLTPLHSQIELRPLFGTQSSKFKDLDNIRFEDRFGIHFGVDAVIGNQVYIQPGLRYEGVKNKVEPDGSILFDGTTVNVSQFTIPLIIGYRLADPDNNPFINVRLFTGPSLSFITDVENDESQLNIEREDFNEAQLGWNAGAGVDVLFLYLDVGYRFGMSDLFDDFVVEGISVGNSNHDMFYLTAGVRLPLN